MEFKLLSGRAGVKRTLPLKGIRVLFGHVSQYVTSGVSALKNSDAGSIDLQEVDKMWKRLVD